MSRPRKGIILTVISLTLTIVCLLLAERVLWAGSKNSLWRVRSESNTIYLQGSIHLLKSENYPLNPSIEKAFEESQVLVLEADLREMADPKTQQMMLKKGMLPPELSLEDQLSKETYDLAKKETAELGIDISAFMRFKPWMFSLTIMVTELQKLGFNPQHGIDMYFFTKALRSGKQIIGLETLEHQLDIFDSLSKQQQDALVRQTLKDLHVVKKKMNHVVRAWSNGETGKLEDFMLESFREFPIIYRLIVVERNNRWMELIESLLREQDNYMIVVGVLHLVGDDGLVALLKQKGYIVDQL